MPIDGLMVALWDMHAAVHDGTAASLIFDIY